MPVDSLVSVTVSSAAYFAWTRGDIALVDFRLFIQQRKRYAHRFYQCHDNRVQLHGIMADGLVELAGQHQEAGQTAQRQAAAKAADDQRTADDGANYVGQVAQLAVDRHCHQRVGVGLVGAVEQLIVEFVELLDGGFLMAENLDDLLAVHHFLDIAVDLAQFLLLLDEELAGISGQVLANGITPTIASASASGDAEVNHREQHAD